MKRAGLVAVGVAAVIVAGCGTPTAVTRVDSSHYIIRDTGEGANPEKGLRKTCFKHGRSVARIKTVHDGNDDSIVVTCE